jgi:osmotically-inducible protein OsmY
MANHKRGQRDFQRSHWQNRSNNSSAPYYSENRRNEERYGDDFGRPYSGDYPYTERNYNQDYNYPYGTGSRNQSNYRGGTYEGGYSNPDYRHVDDYRQSGGHDRYRTGNYDSGQYNNQYGNNYRQRGTDRMDHRRNEFENFGDQEGNGYRNPWERANEGNASWPESQEANFWQRQRNEQGGGQFRGKGPKGYTRSDERIKEDISDRLADHDDIDASEVEVTVNKGEVVLSGTVNDRYEKRKAEECAEQVSGVVNVENRIRLHQHVAETSGERTGSSKTNYSTERGKTKNHAMNES